jgi:hypothetical protein
MKKTIFTLLLAFVVIGFVSAQSLESGNFSYPIHKNFDKKSQMISNSKFSIVDTSLFFLARLSSADSAKAIGVYNSSANSVGQYFNRPQPMQVTGASFYAVANPSGTVASVNCTVTIYNCTADSLPSGVALSSVVVAVDSSYNNGIEIFATFPSAVSVTGPYIITITNASASPVYVFSTNYKTYDGQGDGYATAKIGTTWYHARELSVGGFAYDADFLISPIVSYTSPTPTYTFSPSCITDNTDVTFTLTAPPIYLDRMYNYWAYQDSTFVQFNWNYGDGSAIVQALTNNHTYVTAADYTSKLYYYFVGWSYASGIDSVSQVVGICTGIEDKMTTDISVYPNPANDVLNLENMPNSEIEMYNSNGCLVLRKHINDNLSKIDIASLAEGIYLVKINNESGITSRKIFIQH